ncbi:MAG: 3-keto-disaccharide hydrolase [Steroidobacteraceae bacterium]
MKSLSLSMLAVALLGAAPAFSSTQPWPPGQPWPPNDPSRPQPPRMAVSAAILGLPPPPAAVVLYDGRGLGQWNLAADPRSGWHQSHGLMLPGGKVFNWLFTRRSFGSVQVHLEFREPYPPRGSGQERGNSGVRLMGVYEIQILDADHNRTYADGLPGAVYAQTPPMVLPVMRPGKWQSLDIFFDAPRFRGKTLLSPPYVTVLLDGVVVQDHQEIFGNTSANRIPLGFVTRTDRGPVGLQDHGEASSIVAFRNIWVRPLHPHGR